MKIRALIIIATISLLIGCSQNNLKIVNNHKYYKEISIGGVYFGEMFVGDTTYRMELADGSHTIYNLDSIIGEVEVTANKSFIFSANTDWTLYLKEDGEFVLTHE